MKPGSYTDPWCVRSVLAIRRNVPAGNIRFCRAAPAGPRLLDLVGARLSASTQTLIARSSPPTTLTSPTPPKRSNGAAPVYRQASQLTQRAVRRERNEHHGPLSLLNFWTTEETSSGSERTTVATRHAHPVLRFEIAVELKRGMTNELPVEEIERSSSCVEGIDYLLNWLETSVSISSAERGKIVRTLTVAGRLMGNDRLPG